MDRKIQASRWSPARWPLAAKVGIASAAVLLIAFLAWAVANRASVRTVRLPMAQVTLARVEQGIFHDLIPLRASVEPRETVYVDAIDGGSSGSRAGRGRRRRAAGPAAHRAQQHQPRAVGHPAGIAAQPGDLAAPAERDLARAERAVERSGARRDRVPASCGSSAPPRDAKIWSRAAPPPRSSATKSPTSSRTTERLHAHPVGERQAPVGAARSAAARHPPAARNPARQSRRRAGQARRARSFARRSTGRSHRHRSQGGRAPQSRRAPRGSHAGDRHETRPRTSTSSISRACAPGQPATVDLDGMQMTRDRAPRLAAGAQRPVHHRSGFRRRKPAEPGRRRDRAGPAAAGRRFAGAHSSRRPLPRAHRRQLGLRRRRRTASPRERTRRSRSAGARPSSSKFSSGLATGERVVTSDYTGLDGRSHRAD